jgi:hypothetical protein
MGHCSTQTSNLKHQSASTPLLSVVLQGSCRTIDLRSIADKEWKGDWVQLKLPLNKFDWYSADEDQAFYSCGSSFGALDINTIEFK